MLKESDIGRLSELYQENNDKGGFFARALSCSGSLSFLVISRTKDCDYRVNIYQGKHLLSKGQVVEDVGLFQVSGIIKDWKRSRP